MKICGQILHLIGFFLVNTGGVTWLKRLETDDFTFTSGQRGCTLLTFQGFNYVKNRRNGLKTYWICAKKVSEIVIKPGNCVSIA